MLLRLRRYFHPYQNTLHFMVLFVAAVLIPAVVLDTWFHPESWAAFAIFAVAVPGVAVALVRADYRG